jgi:hypothetical protein
MFWHSKTVPFADWQRWLLMCGPTSGVAAAVGVVVVVVFVLDDDEDDELELPPDDELELEELLVGGGPLSVSVMQGRAVVERWPALQIGSATSFFGAATAFFAALHGFFAVER